MPIPVQLIDLLKAHARRPGCNFVFSSPKGNREYHMLDRCKAVAKRAGLDPAKFDLKTFRSTFASRTLRSGFDVRTRTALDGAQVARNHDAISGPVAGGTRSPRPGDRARPRRRRCRCRERRPPKEPGRAGRRSRPDARPPAKKFQAARQRCRSCVSCSVELTRDESAFAGAGDAVMLGSGLKPAVRSAIAFQPAAPLLPCPGRAGI